MNDPISLVCTTFGCCLAHSRKLDLEVLNSKYELGLRKPGLVAKCTSFASNGSLRGALLGSTLYPIGPPQPVVEMMQTIAIGIE